MSVTDEIHRKELELNEVRRDLASINPALSLHKTLTERKRIIQSEIATLELKREPITLSKASEKVRAKRGAAKKLAEANV